MTTSPVQFLSRPQGRIAYTVEGDGPLVVAIPGMGDLRSVYRDLAASVTGAGFRFAVMDLRGHGDSDTSFSSHGDVETGEDLLALIDELGGPAVALGNSMGAAAAAWAAAERPAAISGLVLFGPFLREAPKSAFAASLTRVLFRVALAPWWGAAFWSAFYGSLNKGTQASWLAKHRRDIRANLSEPGRLRSLRDLAVALDHSVVERRLGDVLAPALVFIGDQDPDYRDPRAEADWIADTIDADVHVVAETGHYPQAQRPDLVLAELLPFLQRFAVRGPRG
ncbi:MAG: alpha/beta hydrolase [Microbacteriaceae bacterium]